jgi:hypothetical protein
VQSAYLPGLRPPLAPAAIRADYRLTPHHLKIDDLVRRLPTDGLLSVQANLATFFTDRPRLVPFPFRAREADWVLIDLTETYAHREDHRKFWLEFERQSTAAKYCDAVREMLSSPDHRVLIVEDGYVLWGKRGAGTLDIPPGTRLPSASEVASMLNEKCTLWEGWKGRGYGK